MKKLREYAQDLLDVYNYFNGVIIFDQQATAVYYYNNRPDINNLRDDDVIGKSLSQIYPDLDLSASTIMKALETGNPTSNMYQKIKNFKGQEIAEVNTTLPIFDGDEIIGAVEVSQYVIGDNEYRNIYLTPMRTRLQRPYSTVDDIITRSQNMELVKAKIRKVARTDSSVLLYGKTGSGKGMAAEAIHSASKRSEQRFVSQNCAAIPASLMESILFGTIRGSFTGAEDRRGLFETADGGTLFLDEINNMSLNLQAKILKVIEDQKVTRVGDYEPHAVNVRVIAATNADPVQLVQRGMLREDLYYRLRVVQIDLPDLKARKEDIPLLAEHFIKKYNRIMNRTILGIDEDVDSLFLRYDWPGNVRELAHTIEGAFNFAKDNLLHLADIGWAHEMEDQTEEEHYPPFRPEENRTLKERLQSYECDQIKKSMEESGTIQELLADLGLSRQNFNHKLKQYGIENKFDSVKKN